jgi:hypothetical protein
MFSIVYEMKVLDSGTAELARKIVYDYLRKALREASDRSAEVYFAHGSPFLEWQDTWEAAVSSIATELLNHPGAAEFMAVRQRE